MKSNSHITSLIFANLLLLNAGTTSAQNVTLSLSIGNPPGEEDTSVTFNIPGQDPFKTSVTNKAENVKQYANFPWKNLQGITLDASAVDIDIKKGSCFGSVPSFINKQGKIIDSLNLTLNFDFIKKGKYQILCDMTGNYANDGTVTLSAKLSTETKPRDISFTFDNVIEKVSLSADSKVIKETYNMSSLLNPLPISTKKTVGTAQGECPAVSKFTNNGQILKAVTYEISYSLIKGLSCIAQPTWQNIP